MDKKHEAPKISTQEAVVINIRVVLPPNGIVTFFPCQSYGLPISKIKEIIQQEEIAISNPLNSTVISLHDANRTDHDDCLCVERSPGGMQIVPSPAMSTKSTP